MKAFCLLVLLLINASLTKAQTYQLCDTTEYPLVIAEVMARPEISHQELVARLQIKFEEAGMTTRPGTAYLEFIVNCNGEAWNFELVRPNGSSLYLLVEELKKLEWRPGIHKESHVDLKFLWAVEWKNGVITLPDY